MKRIFSRKENEFRNLFLNKVVQPGTVKAMLATITLNLIS